MARNVKYLNKVLAKHLNDGIVPGTYGVILWNEDNLPETSEKMEKEPGIGDMGNIVRFVKKKSKKGEETAEEEILDEFEDGPVFSLEHSLKCLKAEGYLGRDKGVITGQIITTIKNIKSLFLNFIAPVV